MASRVLRATLGHFAASQDMDVPYIDMKGGPCTVQEGHASPEVSSL